MTLRGVAMAPKAKTKKRKRPAEAGKPLDHWSPVNVARGLMVGFFVAGALATVAPLHPAVGFMFAGFAAGVAFGAMGPALLGAGVWASAVALLLALKQSGALMAPDAVLSVLAALVLSVAGAEAVKRVSRRTLSLLLLAVLIATFLVGGSSIAGSTAEVYSVEPPAEQYAFDPVFFVKVFYLQERGLGFHEAFGQGFVEDARFAEPTPDLAGWRSPVVTSLWSLLFSSGSQIVYAFLLLSAAAMGAAYYLAARAADEITALVAPAMLAPYYLFAIERQWFPELEFWACFAAIGAAVLWTLKRRWPALGFAVLAGAMREWLLSATLAGVTQHIVDRKWIRAAAWLAGAAAIVALYVVNMVYVRRYLGSVGITPSLGATGRAGGGGPGFILYTVRFCADLFAHPAAISNAAFFLGLVGAANLISRKEFYLPCLLIFPLAAFMVFGSGRGPSDPTGWNDYYGAAFMPFAFILIAASWKFLDPGVRDTGKA